MTSVKIISLIVGIVIISLLGFIYWTIKNIDLSFPDLKQLLLSIKKVQNGKIKINPDVIISNNGLIPLKISDLEVKLYYNNVEFASSEPILKNEFVLQKGDLNLKQYYNIIVDLNNAFFSLIADSILNKEMKLQYSINAKVFNVSIPEIKQEIVI